MKHLVLCTVLMAASVNAETVESLIAQGTALEAKLDSQAALKVFLQAEKLAPDNVPLLIKIAKQYGESMTVMTDDESKRKAGETALAYSQRALKADPKLCDTNLAVAICYGRLIELVPPKTRVEYSRQIHDYGEKAVQIDPKSDYAWHMLGRWHQAVATMNIFLKGIVRFVYGGMPDASLEKAKECFEKAVKLKEDRVCHRIELGRTLAFMGRKEEAKKCIEQGLALPNCEADDADTKARGRETLKAL